MRIRSLSRRAVTLPLTLLLAMALVPVEADPADAGRMKVRVRSKTVPNAGRVDSEAAGARSPIRFRSRSNSSWRPSFDSAERQEENSKPRPKLGAAAAAAARARAALEAEKTAREANASSTGHETIPVGKTTSYSNGVTCVAGC